MKHRTGKELVKVRWVDTLRGSGIHRNRLVAKEFRRGSKVDGFTNFSATLAGIGEADHVDGGNNSTGPRCVVWIRETREPLRGRGDAHRHQQSVRSRSKQRREIC